LMQLGEPASPVVGEWAGRGWDDGHN
jgi:hypothetical protein